MSGFAVSAARIGAPDTGLISYGEMAAVAAATRCPSLANMLEGGTTPVLAPQRLAELSFKIAAYPLTLLAAATRAVEDALDALKAGRAPGNLASFARLREVVGFEAYVAEKSRYATDDDGERSSER